MFLKIIAIAIGLVILPLGYLSWYWSDLNRWIKLLITIYLLVVLFLLYPISTFLWSISKIEAVFPDDCKATLAIVSERGSFKYPDMYNPILRYVFGFTPNYYFSTTIGICQHRLGNYEAAIKALNSILRTEAEFLNTSDRERIERALLQAGSKLEEQQRSQREQRN